MTSQFGEVTFPLDPLQVNYSTMNVADPAQAGLATLIRAVLLTDLGAAFDAAKVGTTVDGYIVESVVPFDPQPWLSLAVTNKFPLVAVYRDKSEVEETTLRWLQRTTEWGIVYILPELDPVGMGKLYPMLNAIGSRLAQAFYLEHHASYNDGYNIWDELGFASARVTKIEPMNYVAELEGNTLINFPAIKIVLKTEEIAGDFPAIVPFLGFQTAINLLDVPTNTKILDFIDLKIDVPQ
jgi:hypothetical protein